MNNDKKTILVTGGAGYLGNMIVRALLTKGYNVRILDKLIFTERSLRDIRNKIELVNKDIRNIGPEVLNRIDAIIHLAAFSTEPTCQCSPRHTDLINHLATEKIAKMAKEKSIERFIFGSSCSIYFTYITSLNPDISKETDIVNPISPYSISKRAAEQALLELADDKFKPIIFRMGTIYGLSPRMRYDLVVNSFVKDALLKRKLTINANGQIWRPLIDIQDVVQAYIKALDLPLDKIGAKIFNICNENWNIEELAKQVQKIIWEEKGIKIDLDIQPTGITRNYKANNSLFREIFHYFPKRTLKEAIFEMWNYLENHIEEANDPINYNDKWTIKLIKTEQI